MNSTPLERIRTRGTKVDASLSMGAGATPFGVFTAPDLLGTRIEYLDERMRPMIEEWVRSGRLPTG